MRRLRAARLASVLALFPGVARASLPDDVEQLARSWSQHARMQRIVPRLLSHGEKIPIVLPAFATGLERPGCSSLGVMASSSVSFVVHRAVLRQGAVATESVASVAGAVELMRCGRQRAELSNLWVEMRSPRGVVEFVVASSPERLPSLRQELPHRDPGPAWPEGEAGPGPAPPPLKARANEWEAQAKRDGALEAWNRLLRADETARIAVDMVLEPGCHRLSGLGLRTERREPALDIDLILYRESPRAVLREDQSENPDASVSLCVAQESSLMLDVLGIPPGDPVVLLHARFPLPDGLPERWGPEARERLAEALWDQHFAGVQDEPVYESLGVTGMTTLPVQVEPNTCYVASAGILRGLVKAFQLRLITPGKQANANATNERPSAALAFCSGDGRVVQLQAEAFGASLAWLAAVWRADSAGARGTKEP